MKNKITLILLLFLILPTVAAADFVAQQYQPYNLIAGCDASGLVCNPGDVQCNISLRDVQINGGGYLIFQNNMTISTNGNANYTFNSSAMNTNGLHPGFISCSDGVANTTESFTLLVTPSGTNSPNLSYLVLFLGVGSFLLLGFSLQQDNSILGFVSGILFLLTSILIFSQGLFDYQSVYTQSVAGIYLVMFSWVGLSSGLNWMETIGARFS